ncbi:G-type lectin S-receptor-like serine/threonine-protein kinase [Tanacetum coccineum]
MENHSIPVFFLITLILLLSDCTAIDTISANQEIKDGETVVSNGEMFELGFFSLGKSKNRYLGIWYKKISEGTVVWVANRETPINDTSGMFKVSSEGNLMLFNGGNNMVWSSNSTVSLRSNNTAEVVTQLLDNGNLIVRDTSLIWQSFDYLGDTLLPGMKFVKDLVTGMERFMTSRKSPDDPSIGVYITKLDTNGYPQILAWQRQTLVSRLGPWNGLAFSGFIITDIPNPILSPVFVVNQKEVYYKSELKTSVFLRIVLTRDGKTLIMHWIERIQDWAVYADLAVDSCGRFGLCGPYGSCSINKQPPCTCIKGFEPKKPKEWDASDWSNGCKRKKPLKCEHRDGFQKIFRVKVPDTRRSWYNFNMTLGKCEMKYRKNCLCTAYTSLDIRS